MGDSPHASDAAVNSARPARKRANAGRPERASRRSAVAETTSATVTIAHSRTPDLAAVCRQADILVVAVGKAGLVRRDYVKPGAVVVDVGMNRVTDERTASDLYPEHHPRFALFKSKGSLLVGDVHPRIAWQALIAMLAVGFIGMWSVHGRAPGVETQMSCLFVADVAIVVAVNKEDGRLPLVD